MKSKKTITVIMQKDPAVQLLSLKLGEILQVEAIGTLEEYGELSPLSDFIDDIKTDASVRVTLTVLDKKGETMSLDLSNTASQILEEPMLPSPIFRVISNGGIQLAQQAQPNQLVAELSNPNNSGGNILLNHLAWNGGNGIAPPLEGGAGFSAAIILHYIGGAIAIGAMLIAMINAQRYIHIRRFPPDPYEDIENIASDDNGINDIDVLYYTNGKEIHEQQEALQAQNNTQTKPPNFNSLSFKAPIYGKFIVLDTMENVNKLAEKLGIAAPSFNEDDAVVV